MEEVVQRVMGDETAQLRLFGSCGNGTGSQSSDIDLCVDCVLPEDEQYDEEGAKQGSGVGVGELLSWRWRACK